MASLMKTNFNFWTSSSEEIDFRTLLQLKETQLKYADSMIFGNKSEAIKNEKKQKINHKSL